MTATAIIFLDIDVVLTNAQTGQGYSPEQEAA